MEYKLQPLLQASTCMNTYLHICVHMYANIQTHMQMEKMVSIKMDGSISWENIFNMIYIMSYVYYIICNII